MLILIIFPSMSWMLFSYLMFLSQTQGEVLQRKLNTVWMNCPEDSVLYDTYCYNLFMTPVNWMDANIACQKQQLGHLAFMFNKSEASFLASLIKHHIIHYSDVWIGLHDPTEGHKPRTGWEWSSKTALNYLAWEKRPPSIRDATFCGSLTRRSGYVKWKAYDCKTKLPFVCKFKVKTDEKFTS